MVSYTHLKFLLVKFVNVIIIIFGGILQEKENAFTLSITAPYPLTFQYCNHRKLTYIQAFKISTAIHTP